MAEQTEQQGTQGQKTNGGDANGHKNAVRAAAIAAATGAAAIAARKALSSREQSGEGTPKPSTRKRSGGGGDSTLAAMATSGLSAAKDSLLPFAEDAAGAAGEWVGRNGPDYLSDTIVPQFIKGFERGRESQQSE